MKFEQKNPSVLIKETVCENAVYKILAVCFVRWCMDILEAISHPITKTEQGSHEVSFVSILMKITTTCKDNSLNKQCSQQKTTFQQQNMLNETVLVLNTIYVAFVPTRWTTINTLIPTHNGRRFADDIFNFIFLYENRLFWFKFHWSMFPRVQLSQKAALVEIMPYRPTGDKPLSEAMMVHFTRYMCICVTASMSYSKSEIFNQLILTCPVFLWINHPNKKLNTLVHKKNGRNFADDNFRCIFF